MPPRHLRGRGCLLTRRTALRGTRCLARRVSARLQSAVVARTEGVVAAVQILRRVASTRSAIGHRLGLPAILTRLLLTNYPSRSFSISAAMKRHSSLRVGCGIRRSLGTAHWLYDRATRDDRNTIAQSRLIPARVRRVVTPEKRACSDVHRRLPARPARQALGQLGPGDYNLDLVCHPVVAAPVPSGDVRALWIGEPNSRSRTLREERWYVLTTRQTPGLAELRDSWPFRMAYVSPTA